MCCTIPVWNAGKGECILCPLKRPDWLWGTHSLLVSMYWPSSAGIMWPGREPNNSPVSSAEVKMLSTKVPLVLRFHVNEQQCVKAVRVSGTDIYDEEWAVCKPPLSWQKVTRE